jgi:hypothetical protein
MEVIRMLSQEHSNSKFYQYLNSNFTVTVLGGLLLWIISTAWQSSLENQKEATRIKERIYSQQMNIINNFSQNFTYSLTLARNYKIREFYISKNINAKIKKSFRDGRGFKETVLIYEKLLETYQKQTSIFTFKAKVAASFKNPPLTNLFSEIEENVGIIIDTDNYSNMKTAIIKAQEQYETALEIMLSLALRDGKNNEENNN